MLKQQISNLKKDLKGITSKGTTNVMESDNGSEFVSEIFIDLLNEKNIKR